MKETRQTNHTPDVARWKQAILQGDATACSKMHVDASSGKAARKPSSVREGTSGGAACVSAVPLGLSIAHISPQAFGTPYKGYWQEGIKWRSREWMAKRLHEHGQRVMRERSDEASISWYEGSQFIKIKSMAPHAHQGGGARGEVKAFSRQSRKRMLDFMRSLNRDTCGLPLFVTLTYPGQYSDDPAIWKRDLDSFRKALRRRYPAAWGPWKLEPQQRGAPHFHLLLFGVKHISKHWLSRTWYRIVGSEDEKHLKAGTQVDRIRSWQGVISYAAKYLGKELDWLPESWRQGVGRWWGMVNKGAAEAHRIRRRVRVNLWAMHRMRRVLRKHLSACLKRSSCRGGFRRRLHRMWQGQGMTFHLPAAIMEKLVPWGIFGLD